jgi:hypothetical protein
MLAVLTAHAPVEDGEEAVLAYVDSIVDTVGTCYRFGLPRAACRPPARGR